MNVGIYHVDGNHLGDKFFEGPPLLDDVFLLDDEVFYVEGRRWDNNGKLEIVVDYVL